MQHKLWQQLQYAIAQQSLPQAMLFIGPPQAQALALAYRVIAECLCEAIEKPCAECSSCVMLREGHHPDLHLITSDGPSNTIKIDMIRDLQLDIYQTPVRGKQRFVLINPADEINHAAANALLKIVEEPPAHAVYFFIAQSLDRIPATLISRCQRYWLTPETEETCSDLLSGFEPLVEGLRAAMQGQVDVCSLVQSWDAYALDDVLRCLYGFTSQLILGQLSENSAHSTVHFFMQLDNILRMKQQLMLSPALNKTLVLEQILLNYLDEGA